MQVQLEPLILIKFCPSLYEKKKRKHVLTKCSIVCGAVRRGERAHGDNVIAALAAEDGGVAPAPAQEQQHH